MAKKKQVTAKFEERKSVENRCDYARLNGKCGRAMCENFGKSCPGRSCEDWKCEAEGEDTAARRGGNVSGAPRALVVEPTGGAVTISKTSYKDRVSEAYGRVETAKDNLLRECVKFGALLTEVEDFLGNEQCRDGSGLKGWLSDNCPEVNYNTAQGYKAMAAKCARMIGGGSQAVAVLQDKTEVIPPGEEEPIEVESKFIEKRDELFSEVKSRRDLEQTYFKFMASAGKSKGGRPKAEKTEFVMKPKEENSADIWAGIKADFEGPAAQKAVKYLNAEATTAVLDSLRRLVAKFEEHLAKISK